MVDPNHHWQPEPELQQRQPGDQVHRLFSEIYNAGWHIKFAHRTFAWTSEAGNAAAVHCVIVGFTKTISTKPRLFDYEHLRAQPHELKVTAINAYLVDGPNVLTDKRTPLRSASYVPMSGPKN